MLVLEYTVTAMYRTEYMQPAVSEHDIIHMRVYLLILVWKCVDVLFLCVSTWHTPLARWQQTGVCMKKK
jgi:hypothetical protein